jgi:hypothetical protein
MGIQFFRQCQPERFVLTTSAAHGYSLRLLAGAFTFVDPCSKVICPSGTPVEAPSFCGLQSKIPGIGFQSETPHGATRYDGDGYLVGEVDAVAVRSSVRLALSRNGSVDVVLSLSLTQSPRFIGALTDD